MYTTNPCFTLFIFWRCSLGIILYWFPARSSCILCQTCKTVQHLQYDCFVQALPIILLWIRVVFILTILKKTFTYCIYIYYAQC